MNQDSQIDKNIKMIVNKTTNISKIKSNHISKKQVFKEPNIRTKIIEDLVEDLFARYRWPIIFIVIFIIMYLLLMERD